MKCCGGSWVLDSGSVRPEVRRGFLAKLSVPQPYLQVKQVYKVGQNCPGFGRSLNGLFKQAITAGKRVRSETSISTGSVSVSSAAVELAQLKLPTHSWDDALPCIIGAGKMSTLLVKHLQSKGCRRCILLNRSRPRAEQLAADFPDMQFDIHLMDDLRSCVEASDVIFAASGSEQLLLSKVCCCCGVRRCAIILHISCIAQVLSSLQAAGLQACLTRGAAQAPVQCCGPAPV